MAEREMFADAVTAGNRRGDEFLSNSNCVRQRMSQRQRGANRGGIGAAGSVRADVFHERRGQKQFGFAIEENIHGFAAAAQMAAFDQRGAAKARVNFPRRHAHFLDGCRFVAGQNFRLVQIGRDKGGERQKFFRAEFSPPPVPAMLRRWWKPEPDQPSPVAKSRPCPMTVAVRKNSPRRECFAPRTAFRFSPPPGSIPQTRPRFAFAAFWAKHGSTARTRRGFCAVRQAMALAPWTPSAAKVFKSAWMPAPPPLSEPAMVSATGNVFLALILHSVA